MSLTIHPASAAVIVAAAAAEAGSFVSVGGVGSCGGGGEYISLRRSGLRILLC